MSLLLTALPVSGGTPVTGFVYGIGAAGALPLGPGLGRHLLSGLEPGAVIQIRIAAVNAVGQGPWSAAKTVTVAHVAAPVALSAPAIGGTAKVGATLVASAGTWSGSPAITLQWLRDGAPIADAPVAGAAGASRVLTADDAGAMISARVTATNAGGTVSATSAGVGPVEALLSSPAAFGASDWTFAAAAATGQTVLTLSAVPDGTKAVDYSFDGGTTVHTLMDAGTGARYLPGLTPGASMSITIRARNSAGASAWTAAKTADAGTVKGAAATTIGTVPASGAPLSHYHMPSQLAGADGS